MSESTDDGGNCLLRRMLPCVAKPSRYKLNPLAPLTLSGFGVIKCEAIRAGSGKDIFIYKPKVQNTL
jgi:hypothetical protein